MLRGGSWRNHAATCRAAYRNGRVDRSTLVVDELSDALERSGSDPTS